MATKQKTTDSGFVHGEDFELDTPDYVIAELRYDSGVAVLPKEGVASTAAAEAEAGGIQEVLASYDIAKVGPHFPLAASVLRERLEVVTAARARVSSEFVESGFMQIVPKRSRDAARIAERLRARKDAVWNAYVAPRPVPATVNSGAMPGSRNFEPAQGYLCSAPDGIGAMHVWGIGGGKGKGVRICDIEGNWNLAHEDLPAGIPIIGGTLVAGQSWVDHGTAVLGEMVSKRGSIGTVGIAHEAKAAVHPFVVNGVANPAAAITGAAARLSAGDAILIELQAPGGPNNKYLALQFWPDVFAAIVAATAKDITVVEAAGNGNENFDLAAFNGTGLQKDSGAIVVGAGIPPTDFFDASNPPTAYTHIGVPRSRIWFSNYGRIVNVHGWGWHVTTCGYGDAQGGRNQNAWYTLRFSGTSSASPIVTGAVACLQGISKVSNGAPLPPARVRSILMKSGTPQQAGPGVPLNQHIGPLPDLKKAATLV